MGTCGKCLGAISDLPGSVGPASSDLGSLSCFAWLQRIRDPHQAGESEIFEILDFFEIFKSSNIVPRMFLEHLGIAACNAEQ